MFKAAPSPKPRYSCVFLDCGGSALFWDWLVELRRDQGSMDDGSEWDHAGDMGALIANYPVAENKCVGCSSEKKKRGSIQNQALLATW